MPLQHWSFLIAVVFGIITVILNVGALVLGAVWVAGKLKATHESAIASLQTTLSLSLKNLTQAIDELKTSITHLDTRLDKHEVRLTVIETMNRLYSKGPNPPSPGSVSESSTGESPRIPHRQSSKT